MRTLAGMSSDINIGIEYKLKEPRTHQIIPSASKALKLSEETGFKNVGFIMDLGHSFLAHENPSVEAVYLINKNRVNPAHKKW